MNRVWAELVGQGFYEPIDDLGPDRTATAPETLDLLATEFASHAYDVKWLMRAIMATKTYQLRLPLASRRGDGAVCGQLPTAVAGRPGLQRAGDRASDRRIANRSARNPCRAAGDARHARRIRSNVRLRPQRAARRSHGVDSPGIIDDEFSPSEPCHRWQESWHGAGQDAGRECRRRGDYDRALSALPGTRAESRRTRGLLVVRGRQVGIEPKPSRTCCGRS